MQDDSQTPSRPAPRWRSRSKREILTGMRDGRADSRSRPLSAAASAKRRADRARSLGPYETRYDISEGYGADRTIIRP